MRDFPESFCRGRAFGEPRQLTLLGRKNLCQSDRHTGLQNRVWEKEIVLWRASRKPGGRVLATCSLGFMLNVGSRVGTRLAATRGRRAGQRACLWPRAESGTCPAPPGPKAQACQPCRTEARSERTSVSRVTFVPKENETREILAFAYLNMKSCMWTGKGSHEGLTMEESSLHGLSI